MSIRPHWRVDLAFIVADMGATFWLGLFVLYLLVVDGLAEKGKSEDLHSIQNEISWQQGQGEIRRMESSLALRKRRPEIALERRQESTFSLDQDVSFDEEDVLPIGSAESNTIADNSENCPPPLLPGKLRVRGGNERRAPQPSPKLLCPLPATGSDTSEPGQQQQPSTQAPGGTSQEQPIVLPKLFRIPTSDGDSPTCWDATFGLMPVGVCQNPQQSPQPSKYDVFMSRNIDIFPRAWKLIDSQPGAFVPVFFIFFTFNFSEYLVPHKL